MGYMIKKYLVLIILLTTTFFWTSCTYHKGYYYTLDNNSSNGPFQAPPSKPNEQASSKPKEQNPSKPSDQSSSIESFGVPFETINVPECPPEYIPCYSIPCGDPILVCHQTGPCEVKPGEAVQFMITISNRGEVPAEDVILNDFVPPQFVHSSGQTDLVWALGTLGPCESKTVSVYFTAEEKGIVCNFVEASACNADPTRCHFCTCVCECCINLVKVGPKEKKVGEIADYEITVTNTGDKLLTDVILVDYAPTDTMIKGAEGAQISGNQALWRWNELRPCESETVSIQLTTCTPGYYTNRVSVDNCQGCRSCAEAATTWKGSPSLNICFEQENSPFCIGDYNFYTLRITNIGQEDETNVFVAIHFPSLLTPISVDGAPSQIRGQDVLFSPIFKIAPRQTIKLSVKAQAQEKGDARVTAEVNSDSLKTALIQQQSTIIN